MELLKLNKRLAWKCEQKNIKSQVKLDFFVDTLCHTWTCRLLYMTIALALGNTFGSRHPITCWIPAHLRRYESFINRVCFIKTKITYNDFDSDAYLKISYYQWIPWILICQTFIFKIPIIIWHKVLQLKLGTNINMMFNVDNRGKYNCQLLSHILIRLSSGQGMYSYFSLTVLFCLVRILYLICMTQLFLVLQFSMAGAGTTTSLTNMIFTQIYGNSSQPSSLYDTLGKFFPLRTLCDVTIRDMDEHRHYTFECLVPLNILNEKIFIIWSAWSLLVCLLIVIDTVLKFFIYACSFTRRSIFEQQLIILSINLNNYTLLELNCYINADMLFYLQIMSQNCNEKSMHKVLIKTLATWELG
ncbi:hypothetical protein GJ496_005181 [Pomphorhynchus laevis]|nr:hypothetical protein GJ496_005181 [Pomphorhynchus laevis]